MKRKAVLTALIFILALGMGLNSLSGQDVSYDKCLACTRFNRLNTEIRDGKIDKVSAQARFRELIPLIRENYYARGGSDWTEKDWAFPVDGYGLKAVGGRNGSGYKPKGDDYFDGNRHRGHAAHDIFICDKNRDCCDDRTGRPVIVRSMTGGIVVAEERAWDASSNLRGGNYIWIYDPSNDGLIYYAHNATILVAVGDVVKPGDSIATVGRTGLNAYKKRSPTHLHLGYVEVHDCDVVARNIYSNLVKEATEKGARRSSPAS